MVAAGHRRVTLRRTNNLSMTRILNCDQSDCPKDWEQLPLAGETHIRVCTYCLKAVYRCETAADAAERELAGHRAALRSES